MHTRLKRHTPLCTSCCGFQWSCTTSHSFPTNANWHSSGRRPWSRCSQLRLSVLLTAEREVIVATPREEWMRISNTDSHLGNRLKEPGDLSAQTLHLWRENKKKKRRHKNRTYSNGSWAHAARTLLVLLRLWLEDRKHTATLSHWGLMTPVNCQRISQNNCTVWVTPPTPPNTHTLGFTRRSHRCSVFQLTRRDQRVSDKEGGNKDSESEVSLSHIRGNEQQSN